MSRSKLLTAFSLAATLMIAGAPAQGASGNFGVGVQVLPARAAPELLTEVPLPVSATASPGGPEGRTVAILHGGLDAALAHFHAAMPGLGYRLDGIQDGGDRVRQVWNRGDEQVRVDLDVAITGPDGLIRLQLSGHGPQTRIIGSQPVDRLTVSR